MPRQPYPAMSRAEWEAHWRQTPGLPIVAICTVDPGHGHGFVRVGDKPACLVCGAAVELLAEPIERAGPPSLERP